MFRHVKDKFGNSLLLQRTPLTTIREEGEDDHVNVGNKRLRFVADPEEEFDSVNKRFLDIHYAKREDYIDLVQRIKELEREKSTFINHETYSALETRVCKLEKAIKKCLQLNPEQTFWDAGNKKITNVGPAETFGDACTFDQTLTYDSTVKSFRAGDKYFNLVETSANRPVLVAMLNNDNEVVFAAYDTETEITSQRILRWRAKTKVLYDTNDEIVWDEDTKQFDYRENTKWGKSFPRSNLKKTSHVSPLPLSN